MKKILNIAGTQFEMWISDKRMFSLILLVFFIDQQITTGLCENAYIYGGKLGIFEPYIATTGSMWLQIIIPVIYIVLMYDYPARYGGRIFYLIRSGRDTWFYGQVVFSAFCALLYTFLIFLITSVLCAGHISFQNSWSGVITDFAKFDPNGTNAAANLIKPSAYYQGSPLVVFGYNFLFSFMNLMLINMLQLALFSYNIRKAGVFINLGVQTVGAVLAFVTVKIKWFFPSANTIFAMHFENYISAPKYPAYISVIYFSVVIVLLWIVGLLGIAGARLADHTEG